jgi:hypothetical protein
VGAGFFPAGIVLQEAGDPAQADDRGGDFFHDAFQRTSLSALRIHEPEKE